MNYTMMSIGDHLPTVGVLQLLLNRAGAKLNVDGAFGPQTEAAVRAFQRRNTLNVDGIVGEKTWGALAKDIDLPIIDSIDVADPTFFDQDASDIQKAGANPIIFGGMCNGVEQAVSQILSNGRNVFLLRFHGHGRPGGSAQGVGDGTDDPDDIERSIISDNPEILSSLSRIASIFGPYGCIQFISCETGAGPEGQALLAHMAILLRVPVSASVIDQPFSTATSFRMIGPIRTFTPRGTLRDWCRALPALPAAP